MIDPNEMALSCIIEAFYPKPIRCEINGKAYFIEHVTGGWGWRNEEGNCQEDFEIGYFASAVECQQSALDFVANTGRAA